MPAPQMFMQGVVKLSMDMHKDRAWFIEWITYRYAWGIIISKDSRPSLFIFLPRSSALLVDMVQYIYGGSVIDENKPQQWPGGNTIGIVKMWSIIDSFEEL